MGTGEHDDVKSRKWMGGHWPQRESRARRYGMWVCVLLLALILGQPVVAATLTFGGDEHFPPYEYVDDSGNPTGFNVELVEAICREMGMDCRVRLNTWDETREELRRGGVDLLVGMFESDQRKRMNLAFSTPYLVLSYAVFVKSESHISSLEDTRGKVIAAEKAGFAHEYLKEKQWSDAIYPARNTTDALHALAQSRVEVALVPRIQGLQQIKEENLSGIDAVGPPILQRPQCFASMKKNERYLALMDEGLQAVKASGEYDDLMEKWFGVYDTSGFSLRDLLQIVFLVSLPFMGIALVVFMWSTSLKRQVAVRTRELSRANEKLAREVHERAVAEAALRESEQRYREIFNTPSDAILVHDAETGVVLDANASCADLLGFEPGELVGMPIGSFSTEEGRFTEFQGVEVIRRAVNGDPQLLNWKFKRRDGSVIWVELSLKAAHLMGQSCVIAVGRDITTRKIWEMRLFEEKERLAVTLKSIGDGVITSDVNGRVVLMNRVAEKLTGWSQAEASGRPMTDIFYIINEKNRKVCENPVEKVLSTGNIVTLANHTALIAKDGSERSIADSGAPIRDRSGDIVGVVLVFRDVTDENRMEEEILKARKLESIGVLAGGIAHDFNNILMAVLGGVSLARAQTPETTEIYTLLTDVLKAGRRARDLTQQLLTFAKGGDPVTRSASVAEVIQESAGFVLHGSRVRCDIMASPSLWPAEIDASQISQVVQNLILNSVQAMPEGGVIRIEAANYEIFPHEVGRLPLKEDRYVKLSFHDDGPGLGDGVIDKVFDPFFTTKETGSGLGLATTHSIITKHDGYIQAGTSPMGGACFTIYLPASNLEPEAQESPMETVGFGRPLRVLVMDDEALVREVVEGLLTRMGHDVELAAGGEEAVSLWRKRCQGPYPYDLVIMDLTVAGAMGGLEAAQQILAVSPDANLVVSSGYSNDPVMADYKAHGFCSAIVKPYTFSDLNEVVTAITA